MNFQEIDLNLETINPFEKIGKEWFLVTAGDEQGFNMMTASWGFMGVVWNKNTAVTMIRPQRYTKEFVDNAQYFTLSFFQKEYQKALSFCGSNSGRDFDKAKETGLTPLFIDGTTSFEEADMILICKKLYTSEMKEDNFVDASLVQANYTNKDFHTAYVGEIVKALKKVD